MKRFAYALALSFLGATAASAGIGDFSLPRLDFPATETPTATQGSAGLVETFVKI